MFEQAPIADLVVPEVGAIRPDDSIRNARRRMESDTRRSLIVVDDDRPVGVVQWRDIQTDAPADAQVSDYMVREFPVLEASMTVDDARSRLGGDVDVDRLPVVGADGRLIGEVAREMVLHHGEATEAPVPETGTMTPPSGTPGMDADMPAGAASTVTVEPEIRPGLAVLGSSGKKLGEVTQAIVDRLGRLTDVQVEHGLLFKKHKRIPADLIARVDEDGVALTIDAAEFKMLPNLEDETA